MQDWRKQLNNPSAGGVYRLTAPYDEVQRAATASGLEFVRIDLSAARSKSAWMNQFAMALHFPDWFGHNWDALTDALTELDWLQGRGLVLVLASDGALLATASDDHATACAILRDAAKYWAQDGRAFWVLLEIGDATLGRWPR